MRPSASFLLLVALAGCVSVRGVTTAGGPRQRERFAFLPADDELQLEHARSPASQAMQREIERALGGAGVTRSDEHPDFWVACYFVVEEKETAPFASPLGPLYMSAPGTSQYLRSTIVVDFIDPATRNVFWRGTARAIVAHPENPDPRQVSSLVDRVMRSRPTVGTLGGEQEARRR